MTKTTDERKAELAGKLIAATESASSETNDEMARLGLFGGVSVWSIIAGHFIDAIEETLRDWLEKRDNEREDRR